MQIFLMRHGNAGPAPRGLSDQDRVLTTEGERQTLAVIRRAKRLVPPSVLISSPFQRARQTAEIVSRELNLASEPQLSMALTPDSRPEDAWRDALAYSDHESIFLVGHEPLFSALAAFLLGHPGLSIVFETSTLVSLDVSHPQFKPRGVLRWMLNARLAAD